MTILSRIKTIIHASVNDMLDKVEDPEKMINQMIRDMDQAIIEIRRETASAMTTHKMGEGKLEKLKEERTKLESSAEIAVRKGDDALALKALERKQSVEKRIDVQQKQLVEVDELIKKLKNELFSLQDKVQEARSKRETLITKKRVAETNRKLMDSVDRAEQTSMNAHRSAGQIIDGFEHFDRMEEHIDRKVAEMEAEKQLKKELDQSDLHHALKELEDDGLKSELDKLKKKLKK